MVRLEFKLVKLFLKISLTTYTNFLVHQSIKFFFIYMKIFQLQSKNEKSKENFESVSTKATLLSTKVEKPLVWFVLFKIFIIYYYIINLFNLIYFKILKILL